MTVGDFLARFSTRPHEPRELVEGARVRLRDVAGTVLFIEDGFVGWIDDAGASHITLRKYLELE